jgi:pilus assembly protein CpaE
MEKHSVVMAVLANESEQTFANQVANSLGYPNADIVIGSPLDGSYAISARTNPPHYIIVDIGSRGKDTLSEIDAMSEQCEEGTRVIVIGEVNDVTFYRELRQRGVIEYFTRPAKVSDVRAALYQEKSSQNTSSSQVISFMSAASGDGSSTIALNTAFAMSTEYKQSTVIIDMDFQFGMIAKNLDLNTPFGIKDLFEHPDRGVDATLVERMTVTYGDSLKVIAAPNDLRMMPPVNPELIRDLIATLRENYQCIIIDVPHIWSNWVSAALSNSNHCVMVSQLWLRSITHSSRLLGSWREIGLDEEQFSIVVNRSGAKFKEAVSSRDFERVCDKQISYAFSNDIRTIVSAENQGKTILEVGNSLLGRQFKEFAGSFLGVDAADEPMPKASTGSSNKSGLTGLFAKKS